MHYNLIPHNYKVCLYGVLLIFALGIIPVCAHTPGTLYLVPLDDRPATLQYPELMAKIADQALIEPPSALLGRFTKPGATDALQHWLRRRHYARGDALIISIDMLLYGGLIGSRLDTVPKSRAMAGLSVLEEIKYAHAWLPILAFNCIMRLAPTADKSTRAYRSALQRYVEVADEADRTGDGKAKAEAASLRGSIPDAALERYEAARRRDHAVNIEMIRLVKDGVIDFLVLCQDDARIFGPHRQEQAALEKEIARLDLASRVRIYPGADEVAMTLIAKQVNAHYHFTPKIAPIFPSVSAGRIVDANEDRPLAETVSRQVAALGAESVAPEKADLLLYVNPPQRTAGELAALLERVAADVQAGRLVIVADVAMFHAETGGSDPDLIAGLKRRRLLDKLAAYASWNTAGNTLGTALSQGNLYLIHKRFRSTSPAQALRGQRAHLEFLLQRYINDYGYHTQVRPRAGVYIQESLRAPVDELEPADYAKVNAQVRRELESFARAFFVAHFKGQRYAISNSDDRGKTLVIRDLEKLGVSLPWPRAFEVRIDLSLRAALE